MAEDLEQSVWSALKTIKFPGMSRDLVSFGFVHQVKVAAGVVTVELQIATQKTEAVEQVKREIEQAVGALPGVSAVQVALQVTRPPAREESAQRAISQDPSRIPDVRHVVAVASGKGGVGKSTVAANLAVTLGQLGHRVGLFDCDVFGPSVPMMFGVTQKPVVENNRIQTLEKYGIQLMSIGFVLDADTPFIMRGPMVTRAIEQLLGDVDWGSLDYLILDLPPGTGDVQITVSQKLPLAGAVIVTTPQDVALIDARKALTMFHKVNVPVLGLIENMSSFVCPHCGEVTDIFKRGGGEKTSDLLGIPFLGAIPLDPAIVEGGDAGVPIVVADREGPHGRAFRKVAEAVGAEVTRASAAKPKLSIV
jgi:ATP-binding protein involved in chromosome partitioning